MAPSFTWTFAVVVRTAVGDSTPVLFVPIATSANAADGTARVSSRQSPGRKRRDWKHFIGVHLSQWGIGSYLVKRESNRRPDTRPSCNLSGTWAPQARCVLVVSFHCRSTIDVYAPTRTTVLYLPDSHWLSIADRHKVADRFFA